MKHLFIDFETFGRNVNNSAVIDLSVFIADTDRMLSDKPYNLRTIAEVKRFKFNVKDQVENCGWIVDTETVKFWSTVSEEARKNIKPLKTDLTVNEFIDAFLKFLIESGKVDYWWSRSNTFDPLILWRIFDSVNKYNHMNEYMPFWRVRDIRTFIDVKLDFPKKNGFIPIQDENLWIKNFVEHDSSWDVLADVLRMQAILRAEEELEMI